MIREKATATVVPCSCSASSGSFPQPNVVRALHLQIEWDGLLGWVSHLAGGVGFVSSSLLGRYLCTCTDSALVASLSDRECVVVG